MNTLDGCPILASFAGVGIFLDGASPSIDGAPYLPYLADVGIGGRCPISARIWQMWELEAHLCRSWLMWGSNRCSICRKAIPAIHPYLFSAKKPIRSCLCIVACKKRWKLDLSKHLSRALRNSALR